MTHAPGCVQSVDRDGAPWHSARCEPDAANFEYAVAYALDAIRRMGFTYSDLALKAARDYGFALVQWLRAP